MSIGDAFREHRNSLAGRIVIAGSAFNLLLAGFYAWQAWDFIPGPDAEEFAAIALVCLAAPVSLVSTWVSYGRRFHYRSNPLLTVLLLLIAAAPLLLSCLQGWP
jgi:hypothetical protein